MGIRYSYELIAERRSADRLVRAIGDHVEPDGKAWLSEFLRLGIGQVKDGVRTDDLERRLFALGGDDVCLSFLFAEDEELAEYASESQVPPVDGRFPVGCVWTSIDFGGEYVLVQATAATSGMSRLFERSASVRETFTEAGQSGGALLVSFDDESGNPVGVWPFRGRFALSAGFDFFEDDEGKLNVDAYCADLVASARRTLGGL